MKKMKTFNVLLLLIIIVGLTGCKKENNTTELIVTVNYKSYPFGGISEANATYWPVTGAIVYTFNDINFNYPVIGGYDYIGNGKLKNKATGAETLFSQKKISDFGIVVFESLQNGTYSVIVDISNIDKNNRTSGYQGSSLQLPENLPAPYKNNTVKIAFDIWPWTVPSDIEK